MVLMGHLSEVHIGAVGLGSMIFNFIYWNFGFLRMGVTGMTAQAYGQNNNLRIAQTLGRALIVGFCLVALMLLFQRPIAQLGLWVMNVEAPQQRELLLSYFYIRIWAAPATLASYVLMGWFFGMQNAIYPLIWTIVLNVVNIVANYVLVIHFGMEAAGVAFGTVIAQYVGLTVGVSLLFYKYSNLLQLIQRKTLLILEEIKSFLKINYDLFLRTLCLTFAFAFFYSQSSSEGTMILAVNVILLQFLNWMSYGVDGFAYASESLVGKYFGANDEPKTRKAIRLTFVWGMGLSAAFSLGYWIFGIPILHLFSNQSEVIAAAIPYLFWVIVLPFAGGPSYLWDGVFVGMTAAKDMRNSMFIALVIYFASFYFLQQEFGNHGLWGALLLFLVARGVIQWILFSRKGMNLE